MQKVMVATPPGLYPIDGGGRDPPYGENLRASLERR